MRSWLLPVVVVGSLLAACSRSDASRRITLSGSSTVAPVVAEIAKRFEAENPGVRIDVQTGGSSRGIAEARSGLADIGLVSRALKPEESDLTAYAIAMDGVCLVVHASNPVRELSQEDVIAIFSGNAAKWSDFGGADAEITVVSKAEGRSTLELFLAHYGLANKDIRAHVVIGDNAHGIKSVAGDPNAIGYVSIGAAEHEARLGTPIRMLPCDGVPATVASVGAGSFPLSRPLNLVTASAPDELERAFIEYCRSASVRDLVRAQHFVPIEQ